VPTLDELEVYLKEYERLRAEIDNRALLQHGILAAGAAAAGATLSVVDKTPEALLGLGLLLTYLWLMWLDHGLQIYRIAAYIATVTRRAIVPSGSTALSWEWWYRHQLPSVDPVAPKTGVSAGSVTIKLFQVGGVATVAWYSADRVHGGLGEWQWLWFFAAGFVLVAHGYVWLKVYLRDWRHAIQRIDSHIATDLGSQVGFQPTEPPELPL
jgi:hypothetical protein